MSDKKNPSIPLGDEQLADISRGTGSGCNCAVLERQFPCMGKCCNKNISIVGTVYSKTCIHCSIWTSLPDGASLAIARIFQCSLYGYDKRIKEYNLENIDE
ncbi:MAG: hypothetical protein VR68_03140 [Peptococcaceae bacterium BRH_c4a]|nr:MAG: hypothetical protein VR68_03140 [Peptococcaceae bacterium BRH_c4a]